MSSKTYGDMIKLSSYHERLEYLKVLDMVYDSPRFLMTDFFNTYRWRTIRRQVLDRDGRFDLGIFGLYIDGPAIVHHIVPITIEDIETDSPLLTDMNNLITVSLETHNATHYKKQKEEFVERRPGDTKLW